MSGDNKIGSNSTSSTSSEFVVQLWLVFAQEEKMNIWRILE